MSDPRAYGVAEFDRDGRVLGLEEKPQDPKSNFAVCGLYIYDGTVSDVAASLAPSPRGELEITDLNRVYLERGALRLVKLNRGTAWLDTGAADMLLHASQFVQVIEQRQGLKIACPEEIAWRQGFIGDAAFRALADGLAHGAYGHYLQRMLAEAEAG